MRKRILLGLLAAFLTFGLITNAGSAHALALVDIEFSITGFSLAFNGEPLAPEEYFVDIEVLAGVGACEDGVCQARSFPADGLPISVSSLPDGSASAGFALFDPILGGFGHADADGVTTLNSEYLGEISVIAFFTAEDEGTLDLTLDYSVGLSLSSDYPGEEAAGLLEFLLDDPEEKWVFTEREFMLSAQVIGGGVIPPEVILGTFSGSLEVGDPDVGELLELGFFGYMEGYASSEGSGAPPVPEPASLLLLGTGLIGLGALRRKLKG